MSEIDNRWMGRVEEKLDGITKVLGEVKEQVLLTNGRTHDNETEIAVLKVKTKKNCESISNLYKKIKEIRNGGLSNLSKTSIWVAIIGSLSAIIIALLTYFTR